jgi:hypothetical protein
VGRGDQHTVDVGREEVIESAEDLTPVGLGEALARLGAPGETTGQLHTIDGSSRFG